MDSLDLGNGYYPKLVYISNRTYAVFYTWNSVYTLRMSPQGNITNTYDSSSSIYSGHYVYHIEVINMPNDPTNHRRFAVFFDGGESQQISLFLRIMTINPIPIAPQIILNKEGSYKITAQGNTVNATIFFADGNHTSLYGIMQSDSFNYIRVTYDKTTKFMNLTINNVNTSQLTQGKKIYGTTSGGGHGGGIPKNAYLIFGPYSGVYNDFRIYSQARDFATS
jgi:hypothetical protein